MLTDLTPFEVAMLRAFYHPTDESYTAVSGPGRRDLRKAALERLISLGLLEEVEPFAFTITHAGHTLLDQED